MMNVFSKIIYSVPKWFYSCIIFVAIALLTLLPDISPGDSMKHIPHLDKYVHFLMFGSLSAALTFDYWRINYTIHVRQIIFCILISVFYGGVIEILQSMMNLGRTGDWFDFMADSFGAIVFALISGYICNKCLKR